ncbi:hypothetical protein HZS55_15985 [Halosimplex rubrum]|uniref:Uncharacterized protein n=1 Tax=Halosimplex rubrum TaxID=869889 RepID=A0A7D5TAP8_9EURY|nr:hypothetical protein [Halosimplex rubrum]QLH75776.1 hypothetical protein HZS55_15985 [Halosimplex rubrum]
MSVFEWISTSDGPTCGCLGCTDPAAKVIDHPEYGERVVCEDDVNGHEVVRDV